MSTVVSINGDVCAEQEARVSVFDRGFLYGDGVFEVMRTARGVPFQLDAHLLRLRAGAQAIGIALPAEASLRRELQAVLDRRAGVESFVRIVVTRGVGESGVLPVGANAPTRVIIATDLRLPDARVYEQGLHAATVVAEACHGELGLEDGKATQYLRNILALRIAHARGAQDALLLDTMGNVIEGATSNVFVVRGFSAVTPASSSGALSGITRGVAVKLLERMGMTVHYAAIPISEVAGVDECFLTSSIRGVVPVTTIDGRKVGRGVVGPVTQGLMAAYAALLS